MTLLANRSVKPLIVDEHESSRVGLAVLLGRRPWVAHCLLARDVAEGQALARRHRPDVAILDVSNTGPFVASATAALRDAHAGLQIVLTSRCAVELPAAPRALGAVSFMPASSSAGELANAVRAALVAQEELPEPTGPDPHALTARERQLLLLISTGATNREIAAALHLGPDAIKKNASALYRKLGVRNRTEATRRASSLLGESEIQQADAQAVRR